MGIACLKPLATPRNSSPDALFASSSLPDSPPLLAPWSLADLAGRLVEISADSEAAHLTAAFGLVLEAQLTGDRAAWVTLEGSSFFPSDVADGGVDLDALPVVRVRDGRMAGRAADHLARSGGFGLIAVDLSGETPKAPRPTIHESRPTTHDPRITIPLPLLTRLLGLAREHHAVILLLTRKPSDAPSIHSLISLRVEARWRLRDGGHDLPAEGWSAKVEAGTPKAELCIQAIKDKRRGPGWTHVESCRGPAGLR
jgi:recombination protein RecA